jgi:hypothetical protein
MRFQLFNNNCANLFRRPARIYLPEQPGCGIMLNEGGGLPVICPEPVFNNLRTVVRAPYQRLAIDITDSVDLWLEILKVVYGTAARTTPATGNPGRYHRVFHLQVQNKLYTRAKAGKQLLERFSLVHRTGESIQNKTSLRRTFYGASHHLYNDIIGYQTAGIHVHGRCPAKICPLGTILPEYVPTREMNRSVDGTNPLALGSLSRTWRAK